MMKIKHAVLNILSMCVGVNAWAGGQVAKSPEDIQKEPAPKSIFLRPAGVSAEQKTPMFVYLHCKTSSPQESQPVLEPLVNAWKCSLLMPCGSTKMGFKNGDVAVYDWNCQTDEATVIQQIKEAKGVNSKAVFLIGFSAGGFMACQLALKHPELFKGVIILSADIPKQYLDDAKVQSVTPKVPFYLVYGTQDPNFPPSRGQGVLNYLRTKGFPATMVTHEGGHFFPDDFFGTIKTAIEWIGEQNDLAKK